MYKRTTSLGISQGQFLLLPILFFRFHFIQQQEQSVLRLSSVLFLFFIILFIRLSPNKNILKKTYICHQNYVRIWKMTSLK
ncbi:hypothetical protein DXC95_11355 [Parabacteroides sp. 20_3]|nr:hypothetical protein HMPREF9008_04077 [Parabacteroides sp. 20_3]MBD9080115.1 hypothetical protein [Parabacteroides distasonis]RGD16754.1 hypothetical protein DW665_12720 [Parabacteroides sp. AM25-14]RGD29070.1 hypothetical protein DW205_12770 [Parabacteroides sp. AM17-47]RKU56270.1 hypothetical protein DWX84_09320 [Parabacteroides sp. AF21-43]RKU72496.1 hypothetical protein DXA72_13365 [Parabacteroides sp. OF04-13BH]RKU77451.1 hypothetical protein DW945_17920 [Parabacteroides sp. AM44-16]